MPFTNKPAIPTTRKFQVWDWLLIACAALAVCAILTLGGCAVGKTSDNRDVFGFLVGDGDLGAAKATASTIGGLIGTAIGGPGGGIIGSGIGETLVLGLAGLLGWRSIKRERTAKAEAEAAFDEGVARGAGVPVAAALPVAPARAKGATA